MKVYVFQHTILDLPNPSFAHCFCSASAFIKYLINPNVAEYCTVFSNPPDMRLAHGYVSFSGWIGIFLRQIEVLLMKRQPFDEHPFGFWFKASQIFDAHFFVVIIRACCNRGQQTLIRTYHSLRRERGRIFCHCRTCQK